MALARSLWDKTLALPAAPASYPARGWRALKVPGPDGRRLIVVARTLDLPEDDAPRLRLAVAADTAVLAEPLGRFTRLPLVAVAVQLQLAAA